MGRARAAQPRGDRNGGAFALIRLQARVPLDFPPLRALKALEKLFPEVPARLLREALAKRDVKQNGARIGADAQVKPGDTLIAFVPAFLKEALDIVFEDEAYLVVNKPKGVPVTGGTASLEGLCARHTGAPVFACHRLDVMTGGLTLLAKGEEALFAAERAFKARELKKTYRALVRGCPSPREAALCGYLRKDEKAARVAVLDRPAPGALPIETRYRVIEEGEGVSRLEVDLITGRTHQIRAHLAHIGHPILGDDKYGDRAFNRVHGARGQRLWATRLTLWDGRTFSVREPF